MGKRERNRGTRVSTGVREIKRGREAEAEERIPEMRKIDRERELEGAIRERRAEVREI